MLKNRNDEHKLATIERFLKDLGFTEELKDSKAEAAGAGLATSLGDGLPASGGMDVAHYADVVKERVSTAWDLAKPTALAAYDAALTAATGAADRLEPMSAKVGTVQDVAQATLGCREPGTCHKPVEQLQVEDIVSSILRRAVSTVLLALSPRLLKSQLGKSGRNVDTLSITRPRTVPKVPVDEVGGHSLWFREFFKSCLPLLAIAYRLSCPPQAALGDNLRTKHLGSTMAWELVRLHAQVQYPHRQDGQDGKLRSSMPRSNRCQIKWISSASPSTPLPLEVIAFDLYRTVQHGTEVIRIRAELTLRDALCLVGMGNDSGSNIKLRNSPGEHQGAAPFSCL
eukprot:Skav223123  [mRNA]  locus=scaffold419:838100:843895:- [translate_table: standard]